MKFKRFFLHNWPIFVIFFLVFLFFWQFFLRGLIPIPADITVGMYFPWLDYKWGYTVGVPVKNSLLSDTVSQFWVWRNLAIDLFRSGQSPFWNPYALSGSPLVPVFHSSFFSPFNLLFFVFDRLIAMGLIVTLQPLLASFFMYLFLRVLKLSNLSSLFGGIIFGFSGFMLGWLEWGNVGHTFLWLPFFLWATEKYLLEKKGLFLGVLIISLGISLSAGHPQSFFYCFSVWFLYFVWRRWRQVKWKSFLLAVLISGLFCLSFSFLILPAIESLVNSIRPLENYIAENNYGFFPLLHVITFLAPDFFGNPATGNWWGKGFNYQEQIGYFGLIPLLFATFSLFSKEKKNYFWKIMFLVSFLFVFKYPFGWLIYSLKIPLLSSASASRILVINAFSGAVLASFGLEMIKKEKRAVPVKIISSFWLIILGFDIATGLSFFLVTKEIKTNFYSVEALAVFNSFANQMKTGLRNLILPTFCLFLISFLSLIYNTFNRRKVFANILILVVFLSTVGELFRFGWKYNPFVKKELYFPQTPLLEYLQKNAGYQRIERERGEVLPPNMWIPYHLYSSSGYDPIYPLNYARFLSILGDSSNFSPSRYAEIDNYRSRFLDLLGIKYVLAIKRDEHDVVSQSGKVSYKFNLDKLRKVYDSGSIAVLENSNAFPRAFLVEDIAIMNPLKADVKIQNYESGKVEIFTDYSQSSYFVLTDTYFPGWKAFIDNLPAKIYPANGTFRAIALPAGSHVVKFVYDPLSFKIGKGVSLVSFLFLIFMTIFSHKLPLFKRKIK